MAFRLLAFILLFSINSVAGQLSLKNPQICHDKDNFLKCYNDDTYILKFGHGDFEKFRTSDSSVVYDNIQKTFTFYKKTFTYDLKPFISANIVDSLTRIDTVQLRLLPKSILIQKGNKSLEITSLSQILLAFDQFGVGNYKTGGNIRGFSFWVDDKYFEIKVSDSNIWSWNIHMQENNRRFSIQYASHKNNRLSIIFIQDDSLKYGMTISTTFKSLRKISSLESIYVDTMTVGGKAAIGKYPLDKYYYYEYNKKGKLIFKTLVGEMKHCDCD